MNNHKRNTTGICAGILMAMLVGSPAVADDTELLLKPPPASANNRPNILFILDTSGSMNTDEATVEPYDFAQPYGGVCDSTRIYWSDVNVVPDCVTTENYIDKDNFFCQAAIDQINGIGSFVGTMVQYRDGGKDGTSSGAKKWQYIAPGYNSEPVDCEGDSGVHGDGRATHLWLKNGSDLSDWYTDNPAEEVSWGSAPRNLGYATYDGNYLNWKNVAGQRRHQSNRYRQSGGVGRIEGDQRCQCRHHALQSGRGRADHPGDDRP